MRRLILLLAALVAAGAIAGEANAWSSGGINTGPKKPYHSCGWVDLWKTGHIPLPYNTTAYKFHLYARMCWGQDEKIDKGSIYTRTYWNKESPFTDVKGVVAKSNTLTRCKNRYGHRVKRHCWVGYRKGKATLNIPGVTVITCYPWVKVTIEADSANLYGAVKFWNVGSNSGTFC